MNTGGRLYGYRSVPVEHPTDMDEHGRPVIVEVGKAIEPEQATIVREIFQMYAEGYSCKGIAKILNERGVRSARGGTWAGTAIRPMLRNEHSLAD